MGSRKERTRQKTCVGGGGAWGRALWGSEPGLEGPKACFGIPAPRFSRSVTTGESLSSVRSQFPCTNMETAWHSPQDREPPNRT